MQSSLSARLTRLRWHLKLAGDDIIHLEGDTVEPNGLDDAGDVIGLEDSTLTSLYTTILEREWQSDYALTVTDSLSSVMYGRSYKRSI